MASGIAALQLAQTIMIDMATYADIDMAPTPTLQLPFNPVCFQFIGNYFLNKEITGMVIKHNASEKALPEQFVPKHLPPGPRTIPETFLIWVWDRDWDLRVAAFTTTGKPFLNPASKLAMTEVDHNLYRSTWLLANLLCQYVNNRERTALQPNNPHGAPIAPKAVRKGAPVAYYTCLLHPKTIQPEPTTVVTPTEPTDRHVSICFDVRGHWRVYKSGLRGWVKAHQRGLGHEYVPKVYIADTRPERTP